MAGPSRRPKSPGAPTRNPQMFIVPPIVHDFVFGVLRREFNGVTNSATEFVYKKLHPFQPTALAGDPSGRVWRPTAAKWEVLLPAKVPEMLIRPQALLDEFESQIVTPRDLVITIKLIFDDLAPLHENWERARHFARTVLGDRYELATILAMHVPHFSAMRNPNKVHVHIMCLARQLTAQGFTTFSELACDAGQAGLVETWKKVMR